MAELPVTYEEAVVVATEIGASLGGRQQQALIVLMRYAERGHRPSAHRLQAVRDASFGAQHFANVRKELDAISHAKSELDAGMRAIGSAAHEIREAELAEEDLANDKGKK